MEPNREAVTHLVCIDIDGTLLCPNHQISPANLKAVDALTQRPDTRVVLATGRAPLSTAPVYKQLQLNTPAICYNGALVAYNPAQPQKCLLNNRLPVSRIGFVAQIAKEFDLTINFFDGAYWYYDRIDHHVVKSSTITANIGRQVNVINLINNYARNQSGPNKIILMGRTADVALARKTIDQLTPEGITPYVVSNNYLEIMPAEISKAVGVKAVQKYYGVETKNIFAIGDGENDMEMLQYAGISVAIHNGDPILQKYAQHISPNHTTDALALALQKYLLI